MPKMTSDQLLRKVSYVWDNCKEYVERVQGGEPIPVGSERHINRMANAELHRDFAKSALRQFIADAIDFFPNWSEARTYVFKTLKIDSHFDPLDDSSSERSDPLKTTVEITVFEVVNELFLEEGLKSRTRRVAERTLRFFWNP